MTDLADLFSEQLSSGINQAKEINRASLEVARAFAALFEPVMSLDALPHASSSILPEGLPSATDAIDDVYNLAGQVLDMQRDYLHRVAEVMTAAVPAELS
jgi:hypothetical protein